MKTEVSSGGADVGDTHGPSSAVPLPGPPTPDREGPRFEAGSVLAGSCLGGVCSCEAVVTLTPRDGSKRAKELVACATPPRATPPRASYQSSTAQDLQPQPGLEDAPSGLLPGSQERDPEAPRQRPPPAHCQGGTPPPPGPQQGAGGLAPAETKQHRGSRMVWEATPSKEEKFSGTLCLHRGATGLCFSPMVGGDFYPPLPRL